jgi:hypothetical protein
VYVCECLSCHDANQFLSGLLRAFVCVCMCVCMCVGVYAYIFLPGVLA